MDVPAPQALPEQADWARTRAAWRDWFTTQAFPRWSTSGVDHHHGGFFEKLDAQGHPVEEPRRTRVVARQLYVCAAAPKLGWRADTQALLTNGLDFLLNSNMPNFYFHMTTAYNILRTNGVEIGKRDFMGPA